MAGGQLRLTTSPGDIYTGDTNPPPGNFVLQDASHAGEDWVIETKIDTATINGGYKQGGLIAFVDGDNYVKFDAISDVDNTRINRLELRAEVGRRRSGPNPADPQIAAGVTDIWLRLTKTGDSYAGEYSLDGTAWTALASPVTNAMADPDFGLYRDRAAGPGRRDAGAVRVLHARRARSVECGCVSSGDEFDGAALDKDRWNAIVRDDDSLYTLEDGALTVTTMAGEIYTAGTPAATRNFCSRRRPRGRGLRDRDDAVSGSISDRLLAGGPARPRGRRELHQVRPICDDGHDRVNRIELRSEEAGVVQTAAAALAAARRHDRGRAAADEGGRPLHGRVLVRRRRPGPRCRPCRTTW